jgi:molecular chaperone IbpA
MRTVDFSPLYRSVVGFDRLATLLEAAAKSEGPTGYPPYNIENVGENAYLIEIDIQVKENLLTVTGRKAANDEGRQYLHRGLAERNFERRFQLADYVIVTDANLSDGLLSIALKRELPESLKARKIEIGSAPSSNLIEGQAAA